MGHYTRLKLDVLLQGDLPDDVLTMLKAMAAGNSYLLAGPLPAHPLFSCERWHVIGYGADGTAFDDVTAPPCLERITEGDTTNWRLQLNFALKNYQDEIQHFLDWVRPYLVSAPGTLVGEWQTEEALIEEEMGDLTRRPTLLVAQPGGFSELVESSPLNCRPLAQSEPPVKSTALKARPRG